MCLYRYLNVLYILDDISGFSIIEKYFFVKVDMGEIKQLIVINYSIFNRLFSYLEILE